MNILRKMDDFVLENIKKIQQPYLTKIMIFSSQMGTFGTVWLAIAFLFLIKPSTRATGFNYLMALCLGNVAGEGVIKHIVRRVRPCHSLDEEELLVNKPRFYSFPSGHTTASFSFLTVTVLRCSLPMILLIAVLALSVTFSRLYLRVHYLSDIFGGIVLGVASGVVTYIFYQPIFDFVYNLAETLANLFI
ncbi:MAG: phosphatase PAP2 family protein [Acutalibacteraceae bacterium]